MNDAKPQSIMWLPNTPTDVLLHVLPGALARLRHPLLQEMAGA